MSRRWTALFLLALLAALLPSSGVEAAEIYRIDPVHTSILFRIRHLGVSFAYGRFRDVSGTLDIDPQSPEKSAVRVDIGADSIDTGHDKRDQHLRSADFFDVAKFPRITFRSTRVRAVGEQTYEITGDLTMHGVTRPVMLRMTRVGSGADPWGGWRTGYEGTVTIERSDFGVNAFDAGSPGALSDEVQLTISVEAVRD